MNPAALILVRHARPRIDPEAPRVEWLLTPDGMAAATALADHLRMQPVTGVLSSPEPAALATTGLIARRLGLTLAVDDGLSEIAVPDLPVTAADIYRASMQRVFAERTSAPFGGETADQALARFSEALRRHAERPLMVVTHGVVMSLYLAPRLGRDPYDLWLGLKTPEAVALDASDRLVSRAG